VNQKKYGEDILRIIEATMKIKKTTNRPEDNMKEPESDEPA
jgi:hypothetical protein